MISHSNHNRRITFIVFMLVLLLSSVLPAFCEDNRFSVRNVIDEFNSGSSKIIEFNQYLASDGNDYVVIVMDCYREDTYNEMETRLEAIDYCLEIDYNQFSKEDYDKLIKQMKSSSKERPTYNPKSKGMFFWLKDRETVLLSLTGAFCRRSGDAPPTLAYRRGQHAFGRAQQAAPLRVFYTMIRSRKSV